MELIIIKTGIIPCFFCRWEVIIIKTAKQMGLILVILFIGQVLSKLFRLPMPGTIMGMILLLILLLLKVIKTDWINDITDVLLKHLPLMFIPSGVAIINHYGSLKGNIIKLFFILFVSIILVMVVTGRVVQYLINKKEGGRKFD